MGKAYTILVGKAYTILVGKHAPFRWVSMHNQVPKTEMDCKISFFLGVLQTKS